MPRWEVVRDEKHRYSVLKDDEWTAPGRGSVTGITKTVIKPDFSIPAWYGYKMGCNAAYMAHDADSLADGWLVDWDEFYNRCKGYENPNSVLTKAGDRGTAIHDALERWAKEGKALNPSDFDAADHKVIQGLASWLLDNDPHIEEAEVMVYNDQDDYCGTFDAACTFGDGPLKGLRYLLDWKTSKGVYREQYFPQLSAYVEAERLCGIEYDGSAVVHIPASGRVKVHVNDESYEDFACLLPVYDSIKAREQREREAKEERKARRKAKEAAA